MNNHQRQDHWLNPATAECDDDRYAWCRLRHLLCLFRHVRVGRNPWQTWRWCFFRHAWFDQASTTIDRLVF